MRIFSPIAAFFAVSILLSAAGFSTEINLITDSNTSMYAQVPDNNLGLSDLDVGTNNGRTAAPAPGRTLIHFDLSSIPAGAIITSATLNMTIVGIPQDGNIAPSNIDLYPMLDSWTQGTGGGNRGSPALPGETTWNERGAGGIAAWGTPGAEIGVDFIGRGLDGQLDSESPDTAASVGTKVGPITFGSTLAFVEDVQSWLDDPADNFGAILISDAEGTLGSLRRLAANDTADLDDAAPPTLTVDYIMPTPEPSTGMLIAFGLLCAIGRRPAKQNR
jgi:hypothetical protein